MRTTFLFTKALTSISMVLFVSFGSVSLSGKAIACERAEQGFEIPDLGGLDVVMKKDYEVAGKKYKQEAFVVNNASFVSRLSCEGKIFTYAFDGNKDGKLDYWIVDDDGDGIFEKLCYPDDETYIPEWVKE